MICDGDSYRQQELRPIGLELFILTLTFWENVRPLFKFFLDVTT